MIPEQYQNLARELAELAGKYKLRGLSGQIDPGFFDEPRWATPITFNWTSGRHGDGEDKIALATTERITVTLAARSRPEGNRL